MDGKEKTNMTCASVWYVTVIMAALYVILRIAASVLPTEGLMNVVLENKFSWDAKVHSNDHFKGLKWQHKESTPQATSSYLGGTIWQSETQIRRNLHRDSPEERIDPPYKRCVVSLNAVSELKMKGEYSVFFTRFFPGGTVFSPRYTRKNSGKSMKKTRYITSSTFPAGIDLQGPAEARTWTQTRTLQPDQRVKVLSAPKSLNKLCGVWIILGPSKMQKLSNRSYFFSGQAPHWRAQHSQNGPFSNDYSKRKLRFVKENNSSIKWSCKNYVTVLYICEGSWRLWKRPTKGSAYWNLFAGKPQWAQQCLGAGSSSWSGKWPRISKMAL